jgi:hypothetical protein
VVRVGTEEQTKGEGYLERRYDEALDSEKEEEATQSSKMQALRIEGDKCHGAIGSR